MRHPDTDTSALESTPDDDFLDEEWLAGRSRRSRLRIALLVALGVAVVFLGGVQVQKHFGTSTAAAGTAQPGAGFAPGGALPEGFPGAGAGSAPGSSSGAPSAGQGADDQTTSVIGTVTKVSGHTWIVTDLGGKKHTITVDSKTKLLQEKALEDGDVATGTTVTVSGTAGDAADLSATSVTVR